MFKFGFIEPLNFIVFILAGVVGLLYSGERVLKALPRGEATSEDRTNKLMQRLNIIMGIGVLIWLTLLIIDVSATLQWLTVILFLLLMLMSFAHPVKRLEGYQTLLIVVPFLIVSLAVLFFRGADTLTVFAREIPLVAFTVVALLFMVGLSFSAIHFEGITDRILFLIGWAPVRFIFSTIVIAHGILLFLYPDDGLLFLF